MMTTLSENDLVKFKKWLTSHLRVGSVTVIFTKKDGTERVMRCTTSVDLVPQVAHTPVDSPTPKKERKVNEEVMPVYDLDSAAWKSFRWDSVKQVSFTL